MPGHPGGSRRLAGGTGGRSDAGNIRIARRSGEMRMVAEEQQPGPTEPEIPSIPRPGPELPGRTGAPPGREIPGIPRPEPELPARPPRRPDAPMDPNAPGQ